MRAVRYHDATKHHFHRFARSLGYLDWARQPQPFREYRGARTVSLARAPVAAAVPYDALFDDAHAQVVPLDAAAAGEFLRCALGLSAWKQYGASRWSLRVNPSSGNLHPTEAYLILPPLDGWSGAAGVYHYAPDRHEAEERCAFDAAAWARWSGGRADLCLVALTSIHWREAWKYGERAFRYCQHDVGHAVAALRLSAARLGWRMRLDPAWSTAAIATLLGLDRDEDFLDAEREEPACVAIVETAAASSGGTDTPGRPAALVDAVRAGRWRGLASRLSGERVEWPLIDEVAAATRFPGSAGTQGSAGAHDSVESARPARSTPSWSPAEATGTSGSVRVPARQILLQRRSALAFDARSTIARPAFFRMLARTLPACASRALQPQAPLHPPIRSIPFDACWWPPHVHLVLFVHRVDDVAPGIYLLARNPEQVSGLRSALRPEFLWEPVDSGAAQPLFLLAPLDVRAMAQRLSCDQAIAADGFFSVGMLARFETALLEHGESFYRCLFWETGMVGQVLYLEAEAAGARGTGIGCFYDDPVHDALGQRDHTFQSLYHFTVGMPVEDTRLTVEPGYRWEAG